MSFNFTEKFSHSSILVIGDFMLDEYVEGSVDRISPEAPVPVVLEKFRRLVPGGAGNVVCNLRALGCRAPLAGLAGKDEAADILRDMFGEMGVDTNDIALIELEDRPTTRKTRILAGNHQICRLDREVLGPADSVSEEKLMAFISESLPHVQALIFSDYDKGVVTKGIIEKTVAAAARHNVFVAVDPQVGHFSYYQNVDILTPNHHEAGRFLGRTLKTDEEVEAGGFEILERLNARMLLITRGEKGMTLFESEGRTCRNFPTQAREVFDVTGAGDTVISLFSLAMACGARPEEAVEISNRGAGIVVGKLGAATVSVEELVGE